MAHSNAFTGIEIPLDAKEAADFVGCRYRRLLQLRALGIVRGYQLVPGGRWHFDRIDLMALKEKLKGRIEVQLATRINLPENVAWLACLPPPVALWFDANRDTRDIYKTSDSLEDLGRQPLLSHSAVS